MVFVPGNSNILSNMVALSSDILCKALKLNDVELPLTPPHIRYVKLNATEQ